MLAPATAAVEGAEWCSKTLEQEKTPFPCPQAKWAPGPALRPPIAHGFRVGVPGLLAASHTIMHFSCEANGSLSFFPPIQGPVLTQQPRDLGSIQPNINKSGMGCTLEGRQENSSLKK